MSARIILSPRAFTYFTRRKEHAQNVCKTALKIPAFGTSRNIATLSDDKNAFAALCGVAGACDVVVRFNLPEKTMFPPTTQTSIRRTGKMKVE